MLTEVTFVRGSSPRGRLFISQEHKVYQCPVCLSMRPRDERGLVADYLWSGFLFRAFGGVSTCRFCGCVNGALELTDGTWYWPDGLAHYVEEHAVRLPVEFVGHVLAEVDKLEEVECDKDWWRSRRSYDVGR